MKRNEEGGGRLATHAPPHQRRGGKQCLRTNTNTNTTMHTNIYTHIQIETKAAHLEIQQH